MELTGFNPINTRLTNSSVSSLLNFMAFRFFKHKDNQKINTNKKSNISAGLSDLKTNAYEQSKGGYKDS